MPMNSGLNQTGYTVALQGVYNGPAAHLDANQAMPVTSIGNNFGTYAAQFSAAQGFAQDFTGPRLNDTSTTAAGTDFIPYHVNDNYDN